MRFSNYRWVIKICLVCVVAISMSSQLALAADYFVATNGNDGNRGTIQQPFRTLERGVQALASGDRLLIRGGNYRRNAWFLMVPSGGGSWETATTIKAYNNEQVILTPQNPAQNGTDVILLPNRVSWVIFDGLILDGRGQEKGMGGRMAFRFSANNHHIRIINTEMRYTHHNLIYTSNATDNEFINLDLHHGSYGIYMASQNNLMTGCDVHHNRYYGIHNYSAHSDFKPNNNSYFGNRLYANGMSGIIIAQSTGVKFINNLSYGNGTGASTGYTGWNRWGIQVNLGAYNVTISHNTTYNNPVGELMLGPSSWNVTARNNILVHNSSENVLWVYKGSSKSVIENNLMVGSGPNQAMFARNWEPTAVLRGNLIGKSYHPKFQNAQNQDFHLTAESSARGKGLVLDEVKTDFDGVTRTPATGLIGAYGFDIGAYQYR
ncbi:MAG TPA: right-handed parallel beta-helix repeat-containing protein [Nitrospirales bacterium]|nr:hypothetical protein [Nitrospiraceae bacterium]HNP28694.1 right-handed parallel beta-helix repeat-containing protein [Nitrospirales bacterium]